MKMNSIIPGIPPYLDPEIIKMGLRLLKKVVDFACEVLVGEVGNKKPVDIEKSNAGELCDVNTLLNKLIRESSYQFDNIEKTIIEEGGFYFEELLQRILLINSKMGKELVNINRFSKKLENINSFISGMFKKHISKRISLDDNECLSILKLAPGQMKTEKLRNFVNVVIAEGLNSTCQELKDRLLDFMEELTELINERIASIESDEVNKIASLGQLSDVSDVKEFKSEIIKMDCAFYIDCANQVMLTICEV